MSNKQHVSGSIVVDTYLGNALLQTTHSGTAGMLRGGLVIVERNDVLDLARARALSAWHVENVPDRERGAPGPDAGIRPGPFVGRREVYTRAVALWRDIEVIPGVELRRDEKLENLLESVRACAQNAIGVVGRAITTLADTRPAIVHAQRIAQLTEGYITTRFPGRRYFVEVGNDREGWIQVCTPEPGHRHVNECGPTVGLDGRPAIVQPTPSPAHEARGHRWGRDEAGGPMCRDYGIWQAHAKFGSECPAFTTEAT
jgi:hypothetical protein